MNDYTGQVAALTGAGSGLAKEIADRLGAHGAKLAIQDYNKERIEKVYEEFKGKGYTVIKDCFDASDYDKVERWARDIIVNFSHVDLLFNNVGVTAPGRLWNIPLSNWQRTWEINVMSVINGIHAFMPYLIAQGTESHIINTSSNAGLSINGAFAPYNATKATVVSISESLAFQTQTYYPFIKAHVLCPGASPTQICYGREQDLVDKSDPYFETEEFKQLDQIIKDAIAAGYPVSEAIDGFFEQFEQDIFYIRPAAHEEPLIQYRIDRILDKTRPIPVHLRKAEEGSVPDSLKTAASAAAKVK